MKKRFIFAVSFMAGGLLIAFALAPLAAKTAGNKPAADEKKTAAPKPDAGVKYPADINKSRVVNQLRYMVGSVAITDLDIEAMRTDLGKLQAARRRGRKRRKARPVSRAEATRELITRSIVKLEAQKESLTISNARVENEIRAMKERASLSSDAEFRRVIERQTGHSFELWLRELPYQLMRQQIIQLRVRVPRPTEAEMRKFYNKNKKKVGFEVSYRMLVFRPRGISQERAFSRMAREAREKIAAKPSRFYRISTSYPRGKYRSYGYRSIFDVVQGNRRLAGLLANLPPGTVGPLFVDRGRYMIVQLRGRRATPFTKVRKLILQRLAEQKRRGSFQAWIEKRKKEIAIIEIK